MAFISDRVFDLGLNVLDTEANRLDICSAEPSTFAAATATLTLGNKTSLSVASPSDRSPNGRKVTVQAITDGTVTASGTAAFWAVTDTVNSRLLATGALAETKAVTNGNPFTLNAIDIGIPDAV